MSEYIDERIVSIKFDNSGFAKGVSETQKSLEDLNKSLDFNGITDSGKKVTNTFKNISNEVKKTDLSPIGNAVENVGEKFSVLRTIATGVFLKIGSDAVEMGKKLIKAVSIDPIAQGFEKYQSILTSQMTLTAALGGKTEEEVEENAQRIKDVLEELTWYADETSYSLDDMIRNVSQFANYGIALEDAKVAMMGIANASAKSGAPLALASHAMEGFSKAMGQGYMSYQVWRTWLNNSKITTLDFKQVMIDTAKAFAKEAGSIGNAAYKNGELVVDMGKTMGEVIVTAENLESTLTKGRWLTTDVMLAALSKYSASMDDLYEATDHGRLAVSELFETSEEGFDKFSLEAFKYAQQCKTLNDVIEALFDATSTTWYRIFQSLIGDYKQTVSLWSDFAEYLFEWFVYPLQEVASMIKDFSESTSNIIDEQTGKLMTMRDVIVKSFMNILEAISSVVRPIKAAFDAVFNPLETLPGHLQNGVEKFYSFTKSLILTEDEAQKLGNVFITIFTILKNVFIILKTIATAIKNVLHPIVETVGTTILNIILAIFKVFYKVASTISSFISEVFGVRDYVAELKDQMIDAAYAFDEATSSIDDNREAFKQLSDAYKTHDDYLEHYMETANDTADSIDDLTEAEEEASEKSKNAVKNEIDLLNKKQEIENANVAAVDKEIDTINKKEKVVTRTETRLHKILRTIFTSFNSHLKTVPVLGKVADYFHNIFGIFHEGTQTVIEGTRKSSNEIEKASEALSGNSKNNILSTKDALENTANTVSNLGSVYGSAVKSITDGSKAIKKDVKDVEKNVEKSSQKVEDNSKKVSKSLGDMLSKAFEELDNSSKSDAFLSIWKAFIERAKVAFDWVKENAPHAFLHIKNGAKAAFDWIKVQIPTIFTKLKNLDIFNTLKNTFETTWNKVVAFFKQKFQEVRDNGFKNMLNSYVEKIKDNSIVKSITSSLSSVWKTVKDFLKEKIEEAGNDENSPFFLFASMFTNIVNWWDDFSYELQKKIKKIKDFFKILFGKGSFIDKLSNSSLYRPFIDSLVSIIDRIDDLQRNIKNIKLAIREGLENAMGDAGERIKEKINEIKDSFSGLKDKASNLLTDIQNVRDSLNGKVSGGGGSTGSGSDSSLASQKSDMLDAAKSAAKSGENVENGIARVIGTLLSKWDNFKEKIEKGINWKTIVKVEELEGVLERLIKAVADAWLKIGLAQLAIDVGNFFRGLGDGLSSFSSVFKKNKNLGKDILEIAIAVGIMAYSFYQLGKMPDAQIQQASDAIGALAKVITAVTVAVGAMLTTMRNFSPMKANAAGGLPGLLQSGLQSIFGTGDTLKQAGQLIVRMAIGIAILAFAFGTILEALKGVDDPAKIELAILIIGALSGILTGMLFAIREFVLGRGSGSKGGPSVALDLSNKTISKTGTDISDILKSFALCIGVIIAAFAIVTAIINKYYTDDSGNLDEEKLRLTIGLLLGMILAVIVGAITMQEVAKQTKDVKPESIVALAKILTPIAAGLAILIYGFKQITKIISGIEDDQTFWKSIGVFGGMIVAIMVLMLVTAALAKWISTGKADSGEYFKKFSNGKSKYIDSGKTSNYDPKDSNTPEMLKALAGVLVTLGFAIKLMASAFSTVVNAIDGIKEEGSLEASIGVFVGMVVLMAILLGEIAIIAYKVPTGMDKVIESIAILFISVGGSLWLASQAIENLAKAFSKIGQTPEGKDAIDKALTVFAVFCGGIIALFSVIAILSSTGGGAAMSTAAVILDMIALAMLGIATSTYVLAKGLNELVNVIIKVGAANEEISAGLDALIELMPKVKVLIIEVMKALIEGLVLGIREAKNDIAIAMIELLDKLLEALAKYLPKIREYLIKIKPEVLAILRLIGEFLFDGLIGFFDLFNEKLPDLKKAAEEFFYNLAEAIVDLFYTGGRIFVKLLEIPRAIASGIVDELRLKLGFTKSGEVKNKDDPDSVYSLGNNMIKGIFQAIRDWIANGKVAKEIGDLWKAIKSTFTSKKNADIESPSKATYKWGEYIAQGLTNGIEDSSKSVSKASLSMWKSFEKPMENEMSSFSAVTSSMLSQLLDADMDFNPVITPVFDMSNLEYANNSVNSLLGSKMAISASTSFSGMQAAKTYSAAHSTENIGPEALTESVSTDPNTRTEIDRLADSITDLANRQSVAPEVNITFSGTSGAIVRALKQDMDRENRRASAFT